MEGGGGNCTLCPAGTASNATGALSVVTCVPQTNSPTSTPSPSPTPTPTQKGSSAVVGGCEGQFSTTPSLFPPNDMVVLVRGNLINPVTATPCTNLSIIRVPVVAYKPAGLGPINGVLPSVSLPGSWDVVKPGHLPCTGMAPAGPEGRYDMQRSGCGRYLVRPSYGCPVGSPP